MPDPAETSDRFAGRIAFVLNPAAGNGAAARRRPALDAAIAASGLDAEVHVSQGLGDVEALARRLAQSADAVVAVGGDGTIHDAVNALAGTGTLFGVVPVGTGNDFAQAIGMPTRIDAAVEALATSAVRVLDVGRVRWTDAGRPDDERRVRVFANAVGIGFDAASAAQASRSKWLGGRSAYAAAVVQTLWSWRRPGPDAEVTVGGAVVFRGPLFLVEVGNGQAVGGGFRLTPEARLDDGLLDVCVVRHARPRRVLRILPTAFTGGHVRFPEVEMHRTAGVSVRVLGGALPVHADGEAASSGASFLEADVWPGALRVMAPRGATGGHAI